MHKRIIYKHITKVIHGMIILQDVFYIYHKKKWAVLNKMNSLDIFVKKKAHFTTFYKGENLGFVHVIFFQITP